MESFLAQQHQAQQQHNEEASRQGDSNNAPAPTDPTATLMASLAAAGGGLLQGQQQNGNVPLLVGATPLQQQLSALAELTGAMNSNANATGSNSSQQQPAFSFAPQPATSMNQLLNPQQLLMQQFQQQQQQQPQQQAPAAPFASPQFGLNLQQLQQLQLAQQLFQAGLAGGLPGFPGGLNLQQASANNPAAALQAQLMVLAGAMGQQPQQQQQPQAQQMLSGTMAAGTPQALMAALQQQQQQQQSQQQQPQLTLAAQAPLFGQSAEAFAAALKPDAMAGVDHSKGAGGNVANAATDADWAEPFSGKGKKEPPFPLKLHQILSNPEFQECICWNAHGRSWRILKPPLFEQIVIPLYFRHAKYASFMRQVNGWGFKRIVSGNDHNSYYHELFVRDMPQLCLKMKRIKRSDVEKPPKYRDAADKDADSGNESDHSPAPPPAATTTAAQTPASTPAMVASTQSSYAPSASLNENFNFLQNSINNQAANGSQPMNSASQLAGMFGIPSTNTPAPSTEAIQGLLMGGSTGAQVGATWSGNSGPAPTASEQHTETPTTHASPFAGLDAATLAKLQEALASASGGGNVAVSSLLQQGAASDSGGGGGLNLMNGQSNAALLMAQLQVATQQQTQQVPVDQNAAKNAPSNSAAEPV